MRSLRAAIVALCALLSSCLEMEQTIAIAPNGSGTQTLRLSMTDKTIAEVRLAMAARGGAGAADPLAIFERAKAEAELKAAGLEVKTHDSRSEGGRRTVSIEAAFADTKALQQSPLCGTSAVWEFAEGPKPGTIRITCYPQGKAAWLEARAQAEAMRKEVDATTAEFFRKRQRQLAGLDLTFRMRLPGKVLLWTRTLELTGENEVTARITAEQIATPEDLVRRLAPRFEVVIDGSGCTLLQSGAKD